MKPFQKGRWRSMCPVPDWIHRTNQPDKEYKEPHGQSASHQGRHRYSCPQTWTQRAAIGKMKSATAMQWLAQASVSFSHRSIKWQVRIAADCSSIQTVDLILRSAFHLFAHRERRSPFNQSNLAAMLKKEEKEGDKPEKSQCDLDRRVAVCTFLVCLPATYGLEK